MTAGSLTHGASSDLQGTRDAMPTSPSGSSHPRPTSARGNADCPWDLFDSEAYLRHNYGAVHELDRLIIRRMAEFFGSITLESGWHGVDVGAGTNLYPALAMLPLVRSVTLWEHSLANVQWLQHGLSPQSQVWHPFWELLAGSAPLYRQFTRAHELLPERATVEKASVFDLPEQAWDIGTMFFVAESITGVRGEFELATEKFVRALRPGSPLTAAFMRDSQGYQVGEHWFPAVAVTEDDIDDLLRRLGAEVRVERVSSTHKLREGFDGMIVVTGWRSTRRRAEA